MYVTVVTDIKQARVETRVYITKNKNRRTLNLTRDSRESSLKKWHYNKKRIPVKFGTKTQETVCRVVLRQKKVSHEYLMNWILSGTMCHVYVGIWITELSTYKGETVLTCTAMALYKGCAPQSIFVLQQVLVNYLYLLHLQRNTLHKLNDV